MREIVRKNSFKRDKIVHKDILGRSEDNSHSAKAVTIETSNISDKELSDVQKLASKVDTVNQDLSSVTERVSQVEELSQSNAERLENLSTTAGEVSQSISEHTQAKTNPHPTDTTQEFAAVNITGLKSDANSGSVPASVYTWFKALYASLVDGSVKSYIIGLLTVVKDLATRVGILEDNYLLKYVVPVDSVGFDLTHDRYGRTFSFTDGDIIEITFRVDAWVNNGGDLNRLNWRVNGVADVVYNVANSFYNYMFTAGASMKSQYPMLRLHIIGKELNYFIIDKYKNSSNAYGQNLYAGMTIGLNADTITSIYFYTNLSSSLIPAGTEILIKKV